MSHPDELVLSRPDPGDDLRAWRTAFHTVFAIEPPSVEESAAMATLYRDHRLTGVRDDSRWVATFRSWRGASTIPGGAITGADQDDTRTLPSELVSTVAVLPSHRRRGLLTRLMADCLDHARETGAVVASLFASEASIYGRYGYGVATRTQALTLDTRAARTWHDAAPADSGRVRMSDDDEIAALGPELFERARLGMPGAVARDEIGWLRLLERMPPSTAPKGPRVQAVHLDAGGEVDGYVRLRTESTWSDASTPVHRATVDDLVGATPTANAALWRFCVGMDLVTSLSADNRGPGEPLALLPVDGRSVRVTGTVDGHWWRVLDPVAALAGRAWSAPGGVVLQVVDPDGPAAGRWRVDVDETGAAAVTATSQSADVTMPVQSLPAVLTGVQDLPPMRAAGRIDEDTPGAVRRLAAMSRVSPVSLAGFQGF